MKKVFTPTLILVGLVATGSAFAESPYSSWSGQRGTEVAIDDSFNREVSSSVQEDNDVSLAFKKSIQEDNDVSIVKTRSEDNDYRSSVRTSEDNDYTSDYRHSEDNDFTSDYRHSEDNDVHEDNDYSSVYTHTEDNDVHEDNDITKTWQQSSDVDFQVVTPTLTGYKYQDQQAGHQADQSVLGAARGHTVAVEGGPTSVSAGNDEQVFFGPAMINNNVNMLPQTDILVNGANYAPISAVNTMAGRDMGDKGNFAPVGNTSAAVSGDTLQSSSAGLTQSGNSGNSIADQMNARISK